MRKSKTVVSMIILLLSSGVLAEDAPAQKPKDEKLEQYQYKYSDADQDREEIRRLNEVIRAKAPWVQMGIGGSLYDARRDILFGHYAPSIMGGYRFSTWGAFGTLKLDRVIDFTQNTQSISILGFGLGVERLSFLGHVRTSITLGLSVLMSDTAIDQAGSVGWFLDIRPGALRWDINDQMTFEFTPFAFDITTPVPTGIPLLLLSYMTVVNVEYSFK